MNTTVAPATSERIDIVDAIRGFALFGIIIAHMANQYYAGWPPPGHENMAVKNSFDGFLQTFHDILIVSKFYTIFSFLFGLSFGIQLLRSKEKGKSFLARFSWRLLLLFMIGFINHIHYRGDILTIYAVLGFFLLLFYKAGNKALLFWSFFFILNMPGYIFRTIDYVKSLQKPASTSQATGMPEGFDMKKMQAEATAYFNMVKKGDYIGIIKTNITKEFASKLDFQVFSGRLSVTFGLFVLGLYIAKRRIFENIREHLTGIKRWLWGTAIFCISMIALYFTLGEKIFQLTGLWGLILSFLGDVFSPALSMVYVAGFILLFQKAGWQKRLLNLAPMGRMGLTTYIMQTMIGVLLFYGYGFNLLDVIGNSATFAIGTVVFIVQMFFSKWWMKYFYYGPFEWFWRSATYFKLQPFRREAV